MLSSLPPSLWYLLALLGSAIGGLLLIRDRAWTQAS